MKKTLSIALAVMFLISGFVFALLTPMLGTSARTFESCSMIVDGNPYNSCGEISTAHFAGLSHSVVSVVSGWESEPVYAHISWTCDNTDTIARSEAYYGAVGVYIYVRNQDGSLGDQIAYVFKATGSADQYPSSSPGYFGDDCYAPQINWGWF